MRITFIDREGGPVTVTDLVGIRCDWNTLVELSDAIEAAIRARSQGWINIEIDESPVNLMDGRLADTNRKKYANAGGPGPSEEAAEQTELPPPWKPWESTEPPPMELEDWQLDLLRVARKRVFPVTKLTDYERDFVMPNGYADQEHRLFSILQGYVAIAPAGLYVLDQAEQAVATKAKVVKPQMGQKAPLPKKNGRARGGSGHSLQGEKMIKKAADQSLPPP